MNITFQTTEPDLARGLHDAVMRRLEATLREEITKAVKPAIDAAVREVVRGIEARVWVEPDPRALTPKVMLILNGVPQATDQSGEG